LIYSAGKSICILKEIGSLIKPGIFMKLHKPIKIMLLFYLSLAVLCPSYEGFEEKVHEFHFFEITESYAEFYHHSQTGIHESYDSDHSHAILYFYPPHRMQRDPQKNGSIAISFIKADEYSLITTECHASNIWSAISFTPYIYGCKTSGLSPPVI